MDDSMNLSTMDIKTIITLLFMGNFLLLVLLAFYRQMYGYRRPYGHFTAGKMFQALAWLLLSMRETIPALLSAYAGNVMLFTGFAFEVYSLTTVGREKKNWGTIYGSIAVAGSAVFCFFPSSPQLWVGYASMTATTIFLTAAAAMLFSAGSSPMRRIVGLFYGFSGIVLAFRTYSGFSAQSGITLMSHNLIQTLTFASLFLLLVVSGTGFLLLFKEMDDRQIRESELKYRTLVENANEVICIIQDGKILFANEKAYELFGLTPAQIIGRPFTDFIYPDDLEMMLSFYAQRGKEDVPRTYQFRVINHEGKPVWAFNSVTMIDYGGKKASMALITNIDRLMSLEKEREKMIEELKAALIDVKTLSGLLPICVSCKKIRNDDGYWEKIEQYIADHSDAHFSHSICPECSKKITGKDSVQPPRKKMMERVTVLLVDDERDFRLLFIRQMRRSCQDHVLVVYEAGDGEEALALLNKGLLPDIIIVDYAMPRMNGLELLKAIEIQNPGLHDVLRIMISGYRQEELKNEAQSLGCAFFDKGTEVDKSCQQICDYLKTRLGVFNK